MNSKTTLPLLEAAAHDEVVDVLTRLMVAYPNNTSNEVARCVARCATINIAANLGRSGAELRNGVST